MAKDLAAAHTSVTKDGEAQGTSVKWFGACVVCAQPCVPNHLQVISLTHSMLCLFRHNDRERSLFSKLPFGSMDVGPMDKTDLGLHSAG